MFLCHRIYSCYTWIYFRVELEVVIQTKRSEQFQFFIEQRFSNLRKEAILRIVYIITEAAIFQRSVTLCYRAREVNEVISIRYNLIDAQISTYQQINDLYLYRS